MNKILLLFLFSAFIVLSFGQPQAPTGHWTAQWIMPAGIEPRTYGVFHFRKSFDLTHVKDSFIIHVSTDQRYHLFLINKSIGLDPALLKLR